MSEVKKIDPRGLEHHERESLIFPSLEDLKKDDTLEIIMEFNPLPLVYLLETSNEYEVSRAKKGPQEWILTVKRVAAGENKKGQFSDLLQGLKKGEIPIPEDVAVQSKKLHRKVDVGASGNREPELTKEDMVHEQIRTHLCDLHLEALKERLLAKSIAVEAPHPVNSFMEEHKIILESLNSLSSFLVRLRNAKSFEDLGRNLKKLKDISHHLVEAESHHQREEEALFPKLAKHDIIEPGEIMKIDHTEFRKRKQALYKLSHNSEDYDFDEFKKRILELGGYLVQALESHIFKEDNIIYQIALQILSEDEWQDVKKECDKIGYCCFTPADQN
jgi:DUF438 domain-containing protein